MTFEVGAIVDGKVTGITNFGAFVELPDGKTGLCHISEIADDYVKDVKDYLKESQQVKVKIISIDEKGKISLSIRQAVEKSDKETDRAPKEVRKSDKPYDKPRRDFKRDGDQPYRDRNGSKPFNKDRNFSRDGERSSARDYKSPPKVNFEDMLTSYLKDSDDKQKSMKKSAKSTRKGNGHGTRK